MNYKLLIIVFFFISDLVANDEKIKIGILYEKIFTTKKEAKIGARLWIKQMKEKDKKLNLEVLFYKNEKKLLEDYKNKNISILISSSTLYYENKKFIDNITNHKWIMSLSKGIFDKYYLIKNKENRTNLKSMNNSSIYYKEEMSKVWLNYLFYKNKNYNSNNNLKKIEKESSLVFNVFFNKDKISIIPKNSYDSIVSLNPQIKQRVEVLEESDTIFFNGIGLTRKNVNKKIKRVIETLKVNFHENKSEYDALSFADIRKIYVLEENDLDKTDAFYEEYLKLKKNRN